MMQDEITSPQDGTTESTAPVEAEFEFEDVDTSTSGDEQEIECPWCGQSICMQDDHTDGCVNQGYVRECDHCGKDVEIEAVDYSVTIYLKRHVVAPVKVD